MSIVIDYTNMMDRAVGAHGITSAELQAAVPAMQAALRQIREKRSSIRWRDLPYNQDTVVEKILAAAEDVRNRCESFVVLGIAGLFSGVVRAPVTGVVLCFELTGSLDALLSATFVAITSYIVANMTRTDPFYEHLTGRMLGVTLDDQDVNEASSRLLHEYRIAAGSMLDGKTVAEVPWPNGALVVNITRADKSIIPRGPVELMAMDHILVVMNETTEFDTNLIISKLCTARTERGRLV